MWYISVTDLSMRKSVHGQSPRLTEPFTTLAAFKWLLLQVNISAITKRQIIYLKVQRGSVIDLSEGNI